VNELRDKVERIVRQVVREVLAEQGERFVAPGPQPLRLPLVAANWKMNGSRAFAADYARRIAPLEGVELVLCPPAILVPVLAAALGEGAAIGLGAQDVYFEPEGAFTGEHAPGMLADAGARYVVIGHSERRALFGEGDELVGRKVRAALGAGLKPILCIGEQLAEREAGATFRVLRSQLTGALGGVSLPAPDPARLVVAYEPVWAIGTGRTASAGQAQEAMAFVRERLAELFSWRFARQVRLLYGGSATPDNAAELSAQPDVDGFLVGGAGLDPDKLATIARRTVESKRGG